MKASLRGFVVLEIELLALNLDVSCTVSLLDTWFDFNESVEMSTPTLVIPASPEISALINPWKNRQESAAIISEFISSQLLFPTAKASALAIKSLSKTELAEIRSWLRKDRTLSSYRCQQKCFLCPATAFCCHRPPHHHRHHHQHCQSVFKLWGIEYQQCRMSAEKLPRLRLRQMDRRQCSGKRSKMSHSSNGAIIFQVWGRPLSSPQKYYLRDVCHYSMEVSPCHH